MRRGRTPHLRRQNKRCNGRATARVAPTKALVGADDPVRPMWVCNIFVGQGPCALPRVREKSGAGLKGMFKKNLLTKLAALAVMPGLNDFKAKLDPNKVGGTAFIGIARPVIKAHGASNAEAIENAIGQATAFAHSGLIEKIEENVNLMKIEH